MRASAFTLLATVAVMPAAAGTVTVTIPRLPVAEYHRPYVAVWLELSRGGLPRTLAVWYDVRKGGKEPGTKWLAELRSWWRKSGRTLKLPADGVSGATQAPGEHVLTLPPHLPPGAYVLNVEAARETGGRELVTVPLTMPVSTSGSTSGTSELGAVTITGR